jgi:protein TonB
MKTVGVILGSVLAASTLHAQDTIKVKPETVSSKSQTTGSNSNSEIFTIVEKPAEFPGGMVAMMNFIKTNIRFPASCRADTAFHNCKVFLKFVVNEDGRISDTQILKSCKQCLACDAEALKIMSSMPLWTPAELTGRKVKCYFNLPISFKSQ